MKKLMQLLRDNGSTERKPVALARNEAAGEASLYIYDVIDAWWGVSAEEVTKAIAGLDANVTLNVHINSPGGDVFEGRAMATAIAAHPGKTVAHIDGLAASAATFVSAAADEVVMADGAFYMIHNGWTIALGDKRVMTETAALLEKVDGSIVNDYAKRSNASAEQIVAWMNDETWFTAQEAVDHGFVDRIAEKAAKASNATPKAFNLAAYDKTPKALLEPKKPEAPAEPVDATEWRAHNERRLRLLDLNA